MQVDTDTLRDTQPKSAGRPQHRRFGAAHASAERTQPAGMSGVTVGTQEHITGQDQPFLSQHLMADAAPDVEEVAYALLPDKGPGFGMVLGVLGSRRGRGVVKDDANHLRVRELFCPQFLIKYIGDGGGIVVGQDAVRAHFQDIPGVRLGLAGRPGQGFFSKGQGGHRSSSGRRGLPILRLSMRWTICGAPVGAGMAFSR